MVGRPAALSYIRYLAVETPGNVPQGNVRRLRRGSRDGVLGEGMGRGSVSNGTYPRGLQAIAVRGMTEWPACVGTSVARHGAPDLLRPPMINHPVRLYF